MIRLIDQCELLMYIMLNASYWLDVVDYLCSVLFEDKRTVFCCFCFYESMKHRCVDNQLI